MRVIDLTHEIREDMPVFPGDDAPQLAQAESYDADGYRATMLRMSTHVGTHMDAPAHIFADGTTVDALPVSHFMGKAIVVDCRDLREGDAITMEQVRACGQAVEQADFLLFNLGWDARWGAPEYFGDYPCIDDEVLDFVIERGFKGVGFDVMGIDPIWDESLLRHKKLFAGRDVVNIENLTNLDQCGRGLFDFGCFPLKVQNGDGSPCRAVAWFEDEALSSSVPPTV